MSDRGDAVAPSYVLQERIQSALENYANPKEDVNALYNRTRRRHDYKTISYFLNTMHVVTNIRYKYSSVATWMVVLPGINSC